MEKFYVFIAKKVSSSNRKNIILRLSSFINKIPLIFYPLFLLYLFFIRHPYFIEALWKPIIAFSVCTVIRIFYNRPRPHQKYNITPLYFHKDGCSFPSRHTTSAMIIAFVMYVVSPLLGTFMILIALLIAISRVIIGVHFISDVIAGTLLAYLIYIL